MTAGLDELELELRRLPGVTFVGLVERSETLVVQLFVIDTPEPGLEGTAEQLCSTHLDVAYLVEVTGGVRTPRVRVAGVERGEEDGGPMVEVHLTRDGVHASGREPGVGAVPAAMATLEALVGLGADVPFEVRVAGLFENVSAEGVMLMLVLASGGSGERYGMAAATTVEQASVRATLHALNRHVADQTFVPPSG